MSEHLARTGRREPRAYVFQAPEGGPLRYTNVRVRVFNPAVYEGYDGIMQWRAEVGETWDSYRSEAEEFFEGPEVVVVFTQEHGRGKGSGIEVQQRPTALLCRLRTDRVSEIRLYHDRERALRDAGIQE